MSKRSDFLRRKHDQYFTPEAAVPPLVRFLPEGTRYVEPCAGDGALVRHLEGFGHVCTYACDIDPQAPQIECRDALTLTKDDMNGADCIITNPPWTRKLLHPMIEHFVTLVPEVWLLFDGDWMFTKQAGPLIHAYGQLAIPTPRLKWIPGSAHTAKDNTCWYMFSSKYDDFVFVPNVEM